VFEILVPISLFAFLLGLGLEIKLADFSALQVKRLTFGLVVGLFIQPLLVLAMLLMFQIDRTIAIGLAILAACPVGPSANVFTWASRGDATFAVTLTTIDNLLSLVMTPLVLGGLLFVIDGQYHGQSFAEFPMDALVLRLLTLQVLPLSLGIFLGNRSQFPAKKIAGVIKKVAVTLLFILVCDLFYSQRAVFLEQGLFAVQLVVALIVLSVILTVLLSSILKFERPQKSALSFVVVIKNTAQGILIASSPALFNDRAFSVPSLIYALAMYLAAFSLLPFMRPASIRAVRP
jgi:BASS family bile acid:Na+ symporter